MPDSERVTWSECPECRETAAVGWWQGRPVEFDCPHGCAVSLDQIDGPDAVQGGSGDQSAL